MPDQKSWEVVSAATSAQYRQGVEDNRLGYYWLDGAYWLNRGRREIYLVAKPIGSMLVKVVGDEVDGARWALTHWALEIDGIFYQLEHDQKAGEVFLSHVRFTHEPGFRVLIGVTTWFHAEVQCEGKHISFGCIHSNQLTTLVASHLLSKINSKGGYNLFVRSCQEFVINLAHSIEYTRNINLPAEALRGLNTKSNMTKALVFLGGAAVVAAVLGA